MRKDVEPSTALRSSSRPLVCALVRTFSTRGGSGLLVSAKVDAKGEGVGVIKLGGGDGVGAVLAGWDLVVDGGAGGAVGALASGGGSAGSR